MLKSHQEITRLYLDLVSSGFLSYEAEEIVQGLENELNAQIKELVLSAVDDAVNIADDIGVDAFADDVTVVPRGYGYAIATKSGKTDYSSPEKDMKPGLLRSGKISKKTGERYRTVPISERKSVDDIFDAQMRANADQVKRRRSMAISNRVQAEAFDNTSTESAVKEYSNARKRFYQMKRSKEMRSDVEYRTVTDSSPEKSWTVPERKLDMTSYIDEINRQLAQSIEIHISTMASFYREEFA